PSRACRSRSPPHPACRNAGDAHDLLFFSAEAQFGGTEQPVDNIVAPGDAVINERGLAVLAEYEQRGHLALRNRRRKLDPGLVSVVKCAQRPPVGLVARYAVIEVQ